jgi:hypothetical protein
MPGWQIGDMATDPVGRRLYVSIHNEVVVFSTETYLIERRVKVGPRARGIALSADGRKLYVALAGGGSIAVVDTTTFNKQVVEIGAELGLPSAWEVLEVRPGVVLVLASCSYSTEVPKRCTSWAVTVDTNNGNTVRRVAGGAPLFAAYPQSRLSRDARYVYIAGDEPGRTAIKLDNTSPDLPVLLQGNHVLYENFELNDSGNWLVTRGGVVRDTQTFAMLRSGWVDGAIGLDPAGRQILQGQGVLVLQDSETLVQKANFRTDCGGAAMIAAAGHDGQWILANGATGFCIFSVDDPATPPGAAAGNRTLPPLPQTQDIPAWESPAGVIYPSDMAVDLPRDRIYVTGGVTAGQTDRWKLTLLGAAQGEFIGDIVMPGEPRTLRLSADGSSLLVGLGDRPVVLVVDPATMVVRSQTDLGALLGGTAVSMLYELTPSRWLASAPHQGGGAPLLPLLEFDPATSGSARVVGDPRGYCGVTPYLSRDRRSLFLNLPGCESSIERRDFLDPALPVVVRSPGYWNMGALYPVESEDGSLLYMMDGYVMRVSTMQQVGKFDVFGRPFLVPNSNQIMFAAGINLSYFDRDTYDRIAIRRGWCPADNYGLFGSLVSSLTVWPDFSWIAALGVGDLRSRTPGGVCFVDP